LQFLYSCTYSVRSSFPDPSAVDSWTDYFFETRIPVFATGGILFVAIVLSNQLTQGASPTHPLEFTLYATVGVFGVGLACASARVHAMLAIWPLLFFVLLLFQMDHPARLFR
jgi:hypothetical protein